MCLYVCHSSYSCILFFCFFPFPLSLTLLCGFYPKIINPAPPHPPVGVAWAPCPAVSPQQPLPPSPLPLLSGLASPCLLCPQLILFLLQPHRMFLSGSSEVSCHVLSLGPLSCPVLVGLPFREARPSLLSGPQTSQTWLSHCCLFPAVKSKGHCHLPGLFLLGFAQLCERSHPPSYSAIDHSPSSARPASYPLSLLRASSSQALLIG